LPDDVSGAGVRGGLTSRTFVATAALILIIGASFAVLFVAVTDLRDSLRRSERAQRVLVVANRLERLVVDLETGERGYLITKSRKFLDPWDGARVAYPNITADLRQLVADDPEQTARVRGLTHSIASYIVDYSVPLVTSVSEDVSPSDVEAMLNEGKRLIDAIRGRFDAFIGAQTSLVSAREQRADALAGRAVVAAAGAVSGSLIIIALFTAYLRGVVRPLVRAAGMANRLSEGDLETRMPETGAGEIGQLERSFNSMASSLAESRDRLEQFAKGQSALRRVATFVAHAAPPSDVFDAVTREVGRFFSADLAGLARYESDDALTVVSLWRVMGDAKTTHVSRPLDDGDLSGRVRTSGLTARVDEYTVGSRWLGEPARDLGIRAAVGAPIMVEGRPWGVLSVAFGTERPPAGTEERLAGFADLVAVAVANSEAREEVSELAREQAALRRVATLVARGRPSEEIFAAVSMEIALVFDAETSVIHRLERDGMATLVATHGADPSVLRLGMRGRLPPPSAAGLAMSTGRSARVDVDAMSGPDGDAARRMDIRSGLASPIYVEGRLWGVVGLGTRDERFGREAERRMAGFTELLATAIANAQSRGELIASRARIVAASDETRRRIERDLHDGAQQRLVSLGLELRDIGSALPPELDDSQQRLSHLSRVLDDVIENLRELSRGIHPAILSQGGLVPALRALARRSTLPVELRTDVDGRLPEQVEVAAYYLVSEALTNVAKHSEATAVEVRATADDGSLELSIRDDGVGGADPARGSGLVGMRDRATALGGSLQIASPVGEGTRMTARLPFSPG
jgi:signal transduction histidine kinase/CHASE3 domain sensor protein